MKKKLLLSSLVFLAFNALAQSNIPPSANGVIPKGGSCSYYQGGVCTPGTSCTWMGPDFGYRCQ